MKRFRDTEAFKWLRTILEILLIVAFIYAVIAAYNCLGFSEAHADGEYTVGYIICVRGEYVNVRPHPNRKGEELGRLEPGDVVYLDGKQKNGFLHCVDLSMESSEGWVHSGYVVYDKPVSMNQKANVVSKGRLAARKYVGGKRVRWLKPMAEVTVYYWSEEWCVTNCGYVLTEYLELIGE